MPREEEAVVETLRDEKNWQSVTRNINTSILSAQGRCAKIKSGDKKRVRRRWYRGGLGGGVGDGVESEQSQTWLVTDDCAGGDKDRDGQKKHYLLSALSISMVTKTDRAIVMGSGAEKMLQSTPLNSLGSAGHCMW